MSRPIVVSPVLRRALWVDALASSASAVPMIVAAPWLASLTGLSASLLWPVGLAMLPYIAYLVWLLTRRAVPAAAVWVPIVLNVLWALDCAWLATVAQPTALGLAFIAAQATAVLVFAGWQWVGLRRPGTQPA